MKFERPENLLERCKTAFKEEFDSNPEYAAQAPGRVNIIGEHTDYNDGFVFPMAINLFTVIVGKKNGSDVINLLTLSEGIDDPKKITFDAPKENSRLEPGLPKWANYCKGVIEHFPHEIPGFDACILSTVPLGGGLSSSASLEVAIATFLESLTGNTLKVEEKALLCQKAEHTFAKMPCGIMDQFISCMGKENSALLIDCRSLETKTVPLRNDSAEENVLFLVVNSNVKHELSGSEYSDRRQDCINAAEILGIKSLRDATMSSLRKNRDKLTDRVYQRALHVVSEIERCLSAVDALQNSDYEILGKLMYQSHVSLRDLYEVSCDELDELVEITMKADGVFGSRMTGGGFGGCIVSLVKASEVFHVIEKIEQSYSKKATSYVCIASDGASLMQI